MNPGGWIRAAVPTTNITDQNARVQTIQARVVQHHYVRAELRDINVRKGDALVEATLAAFQQTPQGRKCTRVQLLHGFYTMTSRLQLADLTINIMATKWFMTPNNERAVRTVNAPGGPVQQMRMTNGDIKNPTYLRIGADSKATFRSDMMNGGRLCTGRRPGSFESLLQPPVETGVRGPQLWSPAAWIHGDTGTAIWHESQIQDQRNLFCRGHFFDGRQRTPQEWRNIHTNARTFAYKQGARLAFVD